MKSIIYLILFLPSILYGRQNYSVDLIPDSLKADADVVYLLDQGVFEIVDFETAVFKVHTVALILNSRGKNHAALSVGYDETRKIRSFTGTVYSAQGKEIRKLKKNEIVDQSSISGFSLYEDNRVQHADLKHNQYPYFVEFQYEKHYNYTYSIPNWYVLSGERISVVHSGYKVISPMDAKPNFKVLNTDTRLIESNENGKSVLTFKMKNVMAKEREFKGPPFSELSPSVLFTPSKFDYEGYKGSFNTWNDLGIWQNLLNEGRNNLPSSTKAEIQKIVNQFDKREDKIRAVYQYVQNKTRYVSIQLGIGGFQPFPASVVDELGYGDCKALSNYTYSLLESVGIDSHYTWVYGGRNPPKVFKDFAADNFNHIILCVPNKQDTIWLECTSQTNPFGYLGTNTGDRDVLIVTETGGKIVHTPEYAKSQNTQNTHAEITLNKDGSAKSVIEIQYAGLQYENKGLDWYIDYSKEEQKKWIYKNTDISDFHLVDFNFSADKGIIPSIQQKMEIDIPRLSKPNNNRMFLPLNLLNKSTFVPKKYEDRQTDLILTFQGIDVDTLIYEVPMNFHPEYIPEPVEIDTEFGSYSAITTFEDGKLIYVRRREYVKGRFDKSLYSDYRNFRRQVSRADKAKAVFVDKT